MKFFAHSTLIMTLLFVIQLHAQNTITLDSGWKAQKVTDVKANGNRISETGFSLKTWMPATVPGTVLTTLLNNKKIADPFFGMNNAKIPDIFKTGRDYYTYWFVKDFDLKPNAGKRYWLHFRGVNYSYDVFLNGKKISNHRHSGQFLRAEYDITPYIKSSGNRLAVIVFPPDPVGDPNGGQGGDGTIARNVASQYTAGWDWIQPIADRNTGIWDKVWIVETGAVQVTAPHIITLVPGVRQPNAPQLPATIKSSAVLQNNSNQAISGIVRYTINGQSVSKKITLNANQKSEVQLPDLEMQNPKLWWPNGYGPQNLYDTRMEFVADDGRVSDGQSIEVGIRQIDAKDDADTHGKKIFVNGQPIFIKGGNWITSDELFRFSQERYDAEIRFHRDMNLNLIRIWGGSLTERPEFYKACDKYGLLVMQDFWMSGDANGRWVDPKKKDSQWTRRQYPDDHGLLLKSMIDQVKMLRNYPSLAIWCGGNEITPPEDVLKPFRDSLNVLDGTRWFVDFSNSQDMSFNPYGGNGDGPYGIQDPDSFFSHHTFSFNSEVGSVGVGDYESLERFLPKSSLVPPVNDKPDPVWDYHKYIGYGGHIEKYGPVKDLRDWAEKAQLVNYNQYRALIEGFSAHMWDWYTGVIIWKTQNPWTALRGQMYDYYLDPNAGLYGLHTASKPLHVMYNPVDGMIMIANNTFKEHRNLMLQGFLINPEAKAIAIPQLFEYIEPSSVRNYIPIKEQLEDFTKKEGGFLLLRLTDAKENILDENLYWFPNAEGDYTGLQNMPEADLDITAKRNKDKTITVTFSKVKQGTLAFFMRISLLDKKTGKRVLPVFYSDNYISVIPGQTKSITIDAGDIKDLSDTVVSVRGWNVPERSVDISK